MTRDKTVDRVLRYYTRLQDRSMFSGFRETANAFLAQAAPIDLTKEPAEVLALLLYAREVKICFYCNHVRPNADFTSLSTAACSTCRAPKNRGYQRRWRALNRERRRQYMAAYRAKKKGTFL